MERKQHILKNKKSSTLPFYANGSVPKPSQQTKKKRVILKNPFYIQKKCDGHRSDGTAKSRKKSHNKGLITLKYRNNIQIEGLGLRKR